MDAKFEAYEKECSEEFKVSLEDVKKSWKPQTDIPATEEIKVIYCVADITGSEIVESVCSAMTSVLSRKLVS